jgi:hypothetical protein
MRVAPASAARCTAYGCREHTGASDASKPSTLRRRTASTPLTGDVRMRHSLARATSLDAMVRSRLHCALLGRFSSGCRAAVQPVGAAGRALHSSQSRSQRRRSSDASPPPLGRCSATRRDPESHAATPRRLRADHAVRTRLCGSAQHARSKASHSTSSPPATSCIHWQRGTLARTGNSPCRRAPPPAALGVLLGHVFPLTPLCKGPFPLARAGACGCECACEYAVWACCAWCLLQALRVLTGDSVRSALKRAGQVPAD